MLIKTCNVMGTNLSVCTYYLRVKFQKKENIPVKLLLEEQMLWLAVAFMEQVAVVSLVGQVFSAPAFASESD